MDKIFDGDDKAKEMGYPDYESFLTLFPQKRRGMLAPRLKGWNGKTDGVHPGLAAHISGGRWLVACPGCGAYSYVTRRKPIHWCMSCGNGEIGEAVKVIFPADADAIEAALLARPVQAALGGPGTQAAMQAVSLVPGLRRDWFPGQSVDWLVDENRENGL
jgi:hypothetical protein